MTTSLYQKYRPTSFADVVGQEHIVTTLQNEIRTGHWSHAYLFSGSRGIGKTTTARLLARAVNCLNLQNAEPCNECANCSAALAGKALDIIEIDAASHTGVDNVRENIIENARVAPASFPWKVFIIDEVHMLSTSAFNALLKTLEEPPARTLFILATTETHKVPATIASRCEQFQFRRVSTDDIMVKLQQVVAKEGVQVDAAALAVVAKRADGGFRDAESLLGQVLALQGDGAITAADVERVLPHADMKEVVTFIAEIATSASGKAMARVGAWYDNGFQLQQYTMSVIEVLRLGLIYRVSGKSDIFATLLLESAQVEFLAKLFRSMSLAQCRRALEVCMQAAVQLKTAPIPALPLELAVAALAQDIPADSDAVHEVPMPAPAAVAAPVAAVAQAQEPQEVAAPTSPSVVEPSPTPSTEDLSEKQAARRKREEEIAQEEQLPVIQLEELEEEAGVEGDVTESEEEAAVTVEDVVDIGEVAQEIEQTEEDAGGQLEERVQETPVAETIVVDVAMAEDDSQATALETEAEPAVQETVAQAPHTAETVVTVEVAEVEAPPADGAISMGLVRKHWNVVLEKLREHDHALYLTMKVGQLAGAEATVVTLGFEYQFYKDRLEDAQNRKTVESVFSEVLGIRVRVDAVVSNDFAKDHQDSVENIIEPSEDEVANVWDLATQQFGPNVSQ